MKKIFKNSVCMFILGAVIFGGIGVVAATMQAKDITYKNTNVESALNDLYQTANKYDSVSFKLLHNTTVTNVGSSSAYGFPRNAYTHFKVTKLVTDANGKDCYATAWSQKKLEEVNLELNQEYNILSSDDEYKFDTIFIYSKSKSSSTWGRCTADITLYN